MTGRISPPKKICSGRPSLQGNTKPLQFGITRDDNQVTQPFMRASSQSWNRADLLLDYSTNSPFKDRTDQTDQRGNFECARDFGRVAAGISKSVSVSVSDPSLNNLYYILKEIK